MERMKREEGKERKGKKKEVRGERGERVGARRGHTWGPLMTLQAHGAHLWGTSCVPGSVLNTGLQQNRELLDPTFVKVRG